MSDKYFEIVVTARQLVLGIVGMVVLILVGFESVTSMGEEAKHPKRDIPRAVLLSLVIQGAVCYLIEYFAAGYMLNNGYTIPNAGASGAPIGDMMVIAGTWLFGSYAAGKAFMLVQAATVFLKAGDDAKAMELFGPAWLEKGGVYVLANIRGGGEFGPRWHKAALKQYHYRNFEDFIAVAEDLVARKITSPRHLGIMGGSQGGLLVGGAFTLRPGLVITTDEPNAWNAAYLQGLLAPAGFAIPIRAETGPETPSITLRRLPSYRCLYCNK